MVELLCTCHHLSPPVTPITTYHHRSTYLSRYIITCHGHHLSSPTTCQSHMSVTIRQSPPVSVVRGKKRSIASLVYTQTHNTTRDCPLFALHTQSREIALLRIDKTVQGCYQNEWDPKKYPSWRQTSARVVALICELHVCSEKPSQRE